MGIAAKNRLENERAWREHVARLKEYRGTVSAYCRDHGISRFTLTYWRKKSKAERTPSVARLPSVRAEARSAFVPVEVIAEPVGRPRVTSPMGLPDPRWLAELVMHLQLSMASGGGSR